VEGDRQEKTSSLQTQTKELCVQHGKRLMLSTAQLLVLDCHCHCCCCWTVTPAAAGAGLSLLLLLVTTTAYVWACAAAVLTSSLLILLTLVHQLHPVCQVTPQQTSSNVESNDKRRSQDWANNGYPFINQHLQQQRGPCNLSFRSYQASK
jgi:hypothetical protein